MTIYPPRVANSRVALAMVTIVDRGIAALQKYVEKMNKDDQPAGGAEIIAKLNWHVVTAADFDKYPRIIRKHVTENQVIVRVLDETGKLVAVLEPRTL